jgi:uncharacterized membrane protein YbhN (UPF0104 family)
MAKRGRGDHDGDLLDIDARKAAKALGIATVLGMAAVGVIGAVTDSGKMLDAVRKAQPAWFAVAVLGQVCAYTGYIVAYRSISRARGGPCLGYWTAGRAVAVGFGAFVLGASAGGLAVDFWVLHRAGESVHQATRRVLALNTVQWLVLGTYATVSAALVLVGLVRYVVTHPLRQPGAIAGFALYWLGDMFTLYAALRAFGVELDPAALVLAYATGYVIVVLPLPAGAGGAAEVAMAFALHLVGVPLGTAILASFAYRFYTVWLPLVPALLFLPAVRGLADDLPHTPRPAHAGAERSG